MSAAKMNRPRGLSAAEQFFWRHAGWAYTPGKESPEQGRANGARNLAAAEALAREAGYNFDWRVDDEIDSSDFSDESPAWALYVCLMRDLNGKVVQSLCGIDFGRKASGPYGDYRRVVEAELASQEADSVLKGAAAEAVSS